MIFHKGVFLFRHTEFVEVLFLEFHQIIDVCF